MICSVPGACDFATVPANVDDAANARVLVLEAVEILKHNLHGCPAMRVSDGTFRYVTDKHLQAIQQLTRKKA